MNCRKKSQNNILRGRPEVEVVCILQWKKMGIEELGLHLHITLAHELDSYVM